MFELKYLRNVSTLKLDKSKCTECRMCTIVCPHEVFTINNGKVGIKDIDSCMECGACKQNCSPEAISVNSGVGCAEAVLYGMINKSEPVCGEACCQTNPENKCC
jgi:NAD-dependent dihydropyrimidine dehydrogenase PreA subunit